MCWGCCWLQDSSSLPGLQDRAASTCLQLPLAALTHAGCPALSFTEVATQGHSLQL